ncbi:DNA gyrase inhibitor YacG [Bosea caraganae]|uniref:DNA gyrase inhibitor YacG n=1 Tax=Bosea caraganae TaxID=2763117 RepID=A0A370L4E9_9HYPH|nr:DNA gyrase inhibitor YacG [Bosea caraganae]RDJ22835.1 DNA gyrase inhibitor YacG [Bosea caraganae]RDJ28614.1 DNA gyrase inhibitor YacG [Bosea caraganae]
MVDEPKAAPPAKPCPICGKPMVQRYKPFCSSRCADIDLGRWLKGSYVVPGEPLDEAETGPSRREDEEG